MIKTDNIYKPLYLWFQNKRKRNFPISTQNLKDTALKISKNVELENFSTSNGHIQRFKKMYNITSKYIVGEAGLVDKEIIYNFKKIFITKIKEYNSETLYNCDETGLFWRQQHNKTLIYDE